MCVYSHVLLYFILSVLVLAVKDMFCVCYSHVLLYSAVSVLVLAVKGMFCVCNSHVLLYFSCISASSSSEGHVLCV